jgi:hypothetical protein
MQEILEQAMNSPQVQYLLENPNVAVAGVTAGSIAACAFVGMYGQVKGER